MSYTKMLISVDGSGYSEQVLEAGMEIAKSLDSSIYVVYVVHPGSSLLSNPDSWSPSSRVLEEMGKDTFRKAMAIAKEKGLSCETKMLEGYPSDEIMDFAERKSVDMIVIGCKGQQSTKEFLLGGVAEKVIRNSKKPVYVVR
ncbi:MULTISPECIES: universal stress protein [Methanohalophilus]|jgi:nucleotide-binding universal stress UspA family protein|nr:MULTISPECIES: universal stress protein [Methanohalophilus]ODV49725.1 MAG: UspA domain protein [Methanohalophilus sp. 2-GBenrich]RSD33875.1 MAG: UspA domain protein [Methanohalophilus sp.]RSD36155.1 MAG: UspA domain protein [Methanohalophilus sp.]RXG33670.1 UspA domain protein [Methanohalophilus sp. WG1-DM]